MISEVEEEVRVTNDGLLQVHGQDQVKLQVCLNVVDITYNSAWLIVVLFTAEWQRDWTRRAASQADRLVISSHLLYSYSCTHSIIEFMIIILTHQSVIRCTHTHMQVFPDHTHYCSVHSLQMVYGSIYCSSLPSCSVGLQLPQFLYY